MSRTFFSSSSVALLLLAAACGGNASGNRDDVSARATALDGTSTVLARLDGYYLDAMTADATQLYMSRNAQVLSIPKAGGAVRVLFEDKPELATHKLGLAVDDVNVYFSSEAVGQIMSVPKDGGSPTVLADHLGFVERIAVDANYVYAAVQGNGALMGRIVRVPKAGGEPIALAEGQRSPREIVLDEANVYFSSTGSLSRVAKSGGAVAVLATGFDDDVQRLVLARGRLAFVNRTTKMLVRTSATEGAPLETIGPTIEALDLATDGTSMFGTTLSHETLSAKMLVLGLDGAAAPALATWSYAVDDAVGYASVASIVDETRIFWADYHVDDAYTHQTTVRSAKRP